MFELAFITMFHTRHPQSKLLFRPSKHSMTPSIQEVLKHAYSLRYIFNRRASVLMWKYIFFIYIHMRALLEKSLFEEYFSVIGLCGSSSLILNHQALFGLCFSTI